MNRVLKESRETMAKYIQKFFRLVLLVSLIAAVFFMVNANGYIVSAEESGKNPHELKNLVGKSECTRCHQQTPALVPAYHTRSALPRMDEFREDLTAMCVTCHEVRKESHPLDVYPKFTVPADLPLTGKGGISCCTCHYTHGSLKSSSLACSVSFLERMFGSDRMKKSFLLRRNNSKGGLCNACHEEY